MKPDPLPPEVPCLTLPLNHRPPACAPGRDWHRLACLLTALAYLAAAGWAVYRVATHEPKPSTITTP